MKKRIGTREYNTETSELIAHLVTGDLYRKRTRDHEYFLLTGEIITPMSEPEARAALGERSYQPKKPEYWFIRVNQETHDKIAAEAKKQHTTMTEIVRQFAKRL